MEVLETVVRKRIRQLVNKKHKDYREDISANKHGETFMRDREKEEQKNCVIGTGVGYTMDILEYN